MKREFTIKEFPAGFSHEKQKLFLSGIKSWNRLGDLNDKELYRLVRESNSSVQRLKKLRGFAQLICQLDIPIQTAALLLHSGIPCVEALALMTPQQIIRQTGRLNRQLNSGTESSLDLSSANELIKRARKRQKHK